MPTIAVPHRPRTRLIVLGLMFVLIGFSSFGSSRIAPQDLPPTVYFTSAPENGATVPYRQDIAWTGSDPDSGDGIHHFEFALDPPDVFTPEEIAHPESAPGVTVTVRPGYEAGRDTIDVTKTVNDTVYTFSWIGTPETSQTFTFETPDYRQTSNDYVGEHRFHVRGRDEEGLYSDADSRQFTAVNEAPASQIHYPVLSFNVLELGTSIYVRATGTDPDQISSTGQPVGYLTKLLRLDTLDPPKSIVTAQPSLLLEGGDSTWTYQEGDTLEMTFPAASGGSYMFGVRAVDENGGTERVLLFSRNTFKFMAFPGGGLPDLTLEEPSTGTFEYRGTPPPEDVEAPGNTPLYFSWLATSQNYPGLILGYSWGVDLADPASETGWSPWSYVTSTGSPLQFQGGETHTFHVRTRDITGGITRGALVLHVVDMTFDREVLLVDDSFDNLNPRDLEHDAFWQDLISDYVLHSDVPAEQFFQFSVHGDDDRGNLQPTAPGLSDLARYKLVVWVNHGAGYNSESALVRCAARSRVLAAYLRAGGKLWLSGRMTVAATIADANDLGADLTYPKTELGPGDFAWDYLKLRSTRINNGKGVNVWDLLHSVWPFPGVPAVYDSMVVDIQKLGFLQQSYGGFSYADAVFDPIDAESDPGFEGDIDTLYAYGAAGPEVQGHGSVYHGKLCALRWHSTEVNPTHGRTQWFGFPMYYMNTEQARQTFRESLDWLRQDDGPVPVSHLSATAVRNDDAVVIRWDVTEGWENAAYSVYHEASSREREQVSPILSGHSHYQFVDRNAPSGPLSYWIAEDDRRGGRSWYGPVTVLARPGELKPVLAPVEPNPVVASARLAYSIPRAGHVSLSVHDLSGRQVALLVNEDQESGRHEITWDPVASGRGRLAAGFYVIRLQAGSVQHVQKALVLP